MGAEEEAAPEAAAGKPKKKASKAKGTKAATKPKKPPESELERALAVIRRISGTQGKGLDSLISPYSALGHAEVVGIARGYLATLGEG